MGQKRISRLRGAGFVAALAVVAMACSNDRDGGEGGEQVLAFNNTVLSIASAGDGSGDVYVGGDFTNYNGTDVIRVVRLNADGTVDQAFATGTGFTNSVRSIAPAGDRSGDLYVGGSFTNYNGTPANDLVRLNVDGTVDQAFAMGMGFNNAVFSIAPAGDSSGDVYAGGQFTSYQVIKIGRLVRLKPNGSPAH
jgi:hypothetical protein